MKTINLIIALLLPGIYLASTSAPVAQVVQTPVATTLLLLSARNPSTVGSNVTFTATVQTNGSAAGDALGHVVFKHGTLSLATNSVTGGAALLLPACAAELRRSNRWSKPSRICFQKKVSSNLT